MKASVARFYWSQMPEINRVLDLGCADGALGKFKPRTVDVYGLEIDPESVAKAAEHETVQQWDLDREMPFPFEDGYFDSVVAKDILEHLQKPWLAVAEIKRVLRPRGLVLASVVCERGGRTWSDYTHVRGFTSSSARKLFSDAGFEVLDVWRMGGVPLTARINVIRFVPHLLRFPLFNWLWTSSYEIKAKKRL